MAFTRWNKAWVIITICSLAAYNIRWLYGVYANLYHILGFAGTTIQITWWRFWVDYVLTGLIGDVVRLAGVILALFAAYLLWGPKPKPFINAKKPAAAAILCEATFFLTLLPITLIALAQGVAPMLMLAYTLQILLVSPVLIGFSRKIWTYTGNAKANVVKWTGIAALSYIAGIWVNNVFNWLNTAATAGATAVLSGIKLLGFLNAVVTLSSTLVLAVAGCYALLRTADIRQSTKMFALALILLGAYFVVFILYSAVNNTLYSMLLVEIWPVTLLGLGLGMLKGET
jgi:hypothetical protein